jgi:hypothetical protein
MLDLLWGVTPEAKARKIMTLFLVTYLGGVLTILSRGSCRFCPLYSRIPDGSLGRLGPAERISAAGSLNECLLVAVVHSEAAGPVSAQPGQRLTFRFAPILVVPRLQWRARKQPSVQVAEFPKA